MHTRHPRVVEDQRGAEFGEGPDEDDGAAGKQAGLNERQRDLPNPAQTGAAEILRRLFHRRVYIGQSRNGVEIDNRVECQRLDQHNAPELIGGEPVERPTRRPQAQMDDEGVECAVLPKDLLDADGADEGRQDHRDEHERTEDGLARENESVADEREWQGDAECENRRGAGEEEGIPQPGQINRVGQQGADVGEGYLAVRIHETAL